MKRLDSARAGHPQHRKPSPCHRQHTICQARLALLLCSLFACAVAQGSSWQEDWRRYRHHLSALRYENQRVGSALANVLNHQFNFPETALRKGVAYVGANHRLRRVVNELLHSNNIAQDSDDAAQGSSSRTREARPVKIALLGGSISWGQGASERGVTDWFSIFSRWVIQAFPAANVTLHNGCVPGTPSSYMVLCLEMSMEDDADLVFVEYALNDGMEDTVVKNTKVKSYERLIRRVLAKPHNPAIILMQVPAHGMATKHTSPDFKPFHDTLEDNYGTLAQFYDLQYLSFRTAIYRLAAHKEAPGFLWDDVMSSDGFHPGDGGFRLMSDLAIWLLQQTAVDLLLRPFGRQDLELLADPLQPSMYWEQGIMSDGKPGLVPNEAPEGSMCLHQDALQQVVTNASGFEFINEGTEEKPKKGYVAATPGSTLFLKLDTWRGGSSGTVSISLAYLRSYVRMGQAVAKCTGGCTCEPALMDGHQAVRNSQLHLAALKATQARTCVISLTVLDRTSSGGTKFKLGGVMVAAQRDGEKGQYDLPQGKWGTFVHENPEVQMTYTKENLGKPLRVEPVDTEQLLSERQGTQAHAGKTLQQTRAGRFAKQGHGLSVDSLHRISAL